MITQKNIPIFVKNDLLKRLFERPIDRLKVYDYNNPFRLEAIEILAQKRNANFGYGSVRIFGPEFGQGRFQEKFETIQLLRNSHKIKLICLTGDMILRSTI